MTNRTIYLYDYVAMPFDRVRAMLAADSGSLIGEAAMAAGARAQSVATRLEVSVGGFGISRDIEVKVGPFSTSDENVASARVHLAWGAAHQSGLFPQMEADLEALPLTADETELILAGEYRPPFGSAGNVIDDAVLHRVAEASVRHFFERIVKRIAAG